MIPFFSWKSFHQLLFGTMVQICYQEAKLPHLGALAPCLNRTETALSPKQKNFR